MRQKAGVLEGEVASLRAAEREREREREKREREREREREVVGEAGELKVRALEAKCEELEACLAAAKQEKEQQRERERERMREHERAKAGLEAECEKLVGTRPRDPLKAKYCYGVTLRVACMCIVT